MMGIEDQLLDELSNLFKIMECKLQLKNTAMLCLQRYSIATVEYC